jgi:regulator of RNase E activity RraA
VGAFVGEVHANILKALGCVAYATNGSVRDLSRVRALGFQFLAPSVAVSHAYVHILDFARPVTVGGLTVASGDILFGDAHGLLNLPENLVEQIPAAVERMSAAEREVIALCQSQDFSLDRLRAVMRNSE